MAKNKRNKGQLNISRKTRRKLRFFTQKTKRKLFRKQKRLEAKMAGAVDQIDETNEALAYKAAGVAVGSKRKYKRWARRAEKNKVTLLQLLAGTVIAVLIVIVVLNTATAYQYSYNGKVLGYVKDQQDVLSLVEMVQEELTEDRDREVIIDPDEDITFKRVFAFDTYIDSSEDVLRRLTYMRDMKTTAYGIFIGEDEIAVLLEQDQAEEALDRVKQKYASTSKDTTVEGVTILEAPKIKETETSLGKIDSVEDAAAKIDDADLTVQTVEVTDFKEVAKYKTIKENTYELYETQKKVAQKGKDGKQQITARIVKNNGKEVERTILEKTILKAPVDKYILIGTRTLPPLKGTGVFKTPVSGVLTSGFGKRWGGKHIGIDLAASYGTPIYAADSGEVIESGYNGSYGKLIKIDHGKGMVSYYGHCSKLLVKAGKKVKQGQHIANVGSTGNSTGAHLHFQVDFVGHPVNPLKYLNKNYAQKAK